jgi:hypothetical protein
MNFPRQGGLSEFAYDLFYSVIPNVFIGVHSEFV